MMFDDDFTPRKKFTGTELGQKLDNFSISELEDYIKALQSEIERTQGDIEKKKSSQLAASTAFKS